MQVNVSWASMQMLPLGLSYLLIISYSLMRQKLPIQLNMLQINLEMHFSVSKRESKLNTTNILNDRRVSSSFCKTHILTFLDYHLNPIWGKTPTRGATSKKATCCLLYDWRAVMFSDSLRLS